MKKKGKNEQVLTWVKTDIPDSTKEISSMITYKDYMIIIYGFYNDDETEALALNVKTNTWQNVITEGYKSLGTFNPSISFYEENKAIVFGQNYRSDCSNELKRIIINETNGQLTITWELIETKTPNPPYIFTTAHVYQGFLYVFGGENKEDSSLNKDIWRLSLDSLKWEKIKFSGDTVEGRTEHRSVLYKDNVYIFFGKTDEGLTKTIMKLNLSSLSCEKLKTDHALLTPRIACSVAQEGSKVYFFGGKEKTRGNNFKVLGELWMYDIEENVWVYPTNKATPVARHGHVSCAINDILFVYGGYGASSTFLSNFEIFKLNLNQNEQDQPLDNGEDENKATLVKKVIEKRPKKETKKKKTK